MAKIEELNDREQFLINLHSNESGKKPISSGETGMPLIKKGEIAVNNADGSLYIVSANGSGLTTFVDKSQIESMIVSGKTELSGVVATIKSEVDILNGSEETSGSVKQQVALGVIEAEEWASGFTLDNIDGLKIEKLETPASGLSAQYRLVDRQGKQLGTTIDLNEDQFLKEAKFYKTKAQAEADGKTVPEGTKFPVLYFKFATTAGETETWVSVKDLVDTYNAGQGINIDSANTISVKIADSGETKNYLKMESDSLAVREIDTDAAILQNAIQITENVGQLKDGQTLTSGMSVYDILIKMLSKEKWSTPITINYIFTSKIGAPSLTKSSGNEVEVGTKVSFTGTSNESYNNNQKVEALKFEYGYKDGEDGTWTGATAYTENLTTGITMTGNSVLKTTITGFSGVTDNQVTANTINVVDAIVMEGENKVSLNQTGKTVQNAMNMTSKELYVATNLKNYTMEDDPTSLNITYLPGVWHPGEQTIMPTNSTNMSVIGKYYCYFGSLSGLGMSLSDATEEAIKALPKNWIVKDGTTILNDATSTGTIVMAVPVKYKMATIKESLTDVDIIEKFETKEMDLTIGGGFTTKYKVYVYKDQAAYVKYKNVTITKA